MGPAIRPNYELRRLIVLTALVLLGYSLVRIGGAIGSAFRTPLHGAAPTTAGSPVSPLPSATQSTSPIPVLVAPPDCTKGGEPAEDARLADWARTLLDTRFRLPSDYVPPNLLSVTMAGFENSGKFLVRSVVIDDLAALRQTAEDAGNPIAIVAAYRSYEAQASLFERRKEDLGLKEAERRTARAGHSEHQLGTAIDLKTFGETDVDVRWDSTPAGQWMLENGWQYGFVQSYPQGKSGVTCYGYEPWHYRYFGRDVAVAIHESGLTVREYLWNQAHGG